MNTKMENEQNQQQSTNQNSQANQQTPQVPIPLKRPTVVKKTKNKKDNVLVEKTKLDLFLEEYEKCDGNGTEAAMRVFNPKSRINAANIAQQYLKRAQALGLYHMEKKGMTYPKLIEMGMQRMQNPKSMDFVPLFDRFMKMGGFADFLTKQGVTKATVGVLSVQKKLVDEYVEGEFVDDEEGAEE